MLSHPQSHTRNYNFNIKINIFIRNSLNVVGVGNADFDNMDELDSDDVRLSADGRYAERDIVQFVPLNKFLSNNTRNQHVKSQADLAKEVLAEIPEQLTSYMKSRGFRPQNNAQNLPPDSSRINPTAPMN